MTPNSLDSSTVFAYHNEPTTIPEALCTSRQQKSGHNGPWSNGSWCACATSVWSSPCDTGYVLLLQIHRPKSSNDINKELTMSSNHGLLYISKSLSQSSSRLSPTRSLNGAWSAYVLSIWGCYGGPPGAPDQMAHNLLWPSPTDALGPNIMPAVTLSLLTARAPLWTDTEGPLTAFQLISSPSSSLTHDNLVSKPRGEDTQRKCFPLELTNGFFFLPSAVVGAGVFHIVSAGDTVYSSHF